MFRSISTVGPKIAATSMFLKGLKPYLLPAETKLSGIALSAGLEKTLYNYSMHSMSDGICKVQSLSVLGCMWFYLQPALLQMTAYRLRTQSCDERNKCTVQDCQVSRSI